MLRNFAYGSLALLGGAITGIAISSWATPLAPPALAPEVAHVASISQPALAASTSSRAADHASDCSPWDVSDVAMETALNEMIRRGWRPPTQAEAINAFQPGVAPLDPGAPVPVRGVWSSPASSGDDATEGGEPFPVEQVPPPSEGAPAPSASPPSPSIVIEEPTPPSN